MENNNLEGFKLFCDICDICNYVFEAKLPKTQENYEQTKTYELGASLYTYFAERDLTGHAQDVFRYVFVKAVEYQISLDVYKDTDRINFAEDFTLTLTEVGENRYPTNLPNHLDGVVDSCQRAGYVFAKEIFEKYKDKLTKDVFITIVNSCFWIGAVLASALHLAENKVGNYNNADLLTGKEVKTIAVNVLREALEEKGCKILDISYDNKYYMNIMFEHEGELILMLVAARVAPAEPDFLHSELTILWEMAQEQKAKPYCAKVVITSADEVHSRDGVILAGDELRYDVKMIGEMQKPVNEV